MPCGEFSVKALDKPVCVCVSGYWSITVYGRKHCYRLYTKHFNEAVHWACAVQKVIDTKAPVETPTQLLIRDTEVRHTHTHTHLAAAKPPVTNCHQTQPAAATLITPRTL